MKWYKDTTKIVDGDQLIIQAPLHRSGLYFKTLSYFYIVEASIDDDDGSFTFDTHGLHLSFLKNDISYWAYLPKDFKHVGDHWEACDPSLDGACQPTGADDTERVPVDSSPVSIANNLDSMAMDMTKLSKKMRDFEAQMNGEFAEDYLSKCLERMYLSFNKAFDAASDK